MAGAAVLFAMLLAAETMTAGMLSGCGSIGIQAASGNTSNADAESQGHEGGQSESSDVNSAGKQSSDAADGADAAGVTAADAEETLPAPVGLHLDDDYRTTYEVFVYSFADGNGDGIGDLKGLTEKLDYINDGNDATTTDLGCNEIWLMPIFPSPTYHKYDATDYESIDPEYGTLEDFDAFLTKCHERDVRVILDLAVNHTSSEHPWFQKAVQYLKEHPEEAAQIIAQADRATTLASGSDERAESKQDTAQVTNGGIQNATDKTTGKSTQNDANKNTNADGSGYLNYYNFQQEPASGYEQVPGTEWYYEARFWSGMPDLNLDNGQVRDEIKDICQFWLDRGVDGFRLDAVTSYYTDQADESTAFIGWLTNMVKTIDPNAYLVGECWEGQKTYAEYYDSGIDSLFDFDFAGQEGVISSVTNGRKKASYYVDRLVQEEALYAAHNPNYVNAPFYTNHDMARSAGYYLYDDGTKCKFAQALNLLQTGNAFIYYGEELGMKGSGRDENKRLPMPWTDASGQSAQASGQDAATTIGNDPGISQNMNQGASLDAQDAQYLCDGPKDAEQVKQKFQAADLQSQDEDSILSYVRRAISLRYAYPVIARGKTTKVEALTNDAIGAFVRSMPGTGKASAEPDETTVEVQSSNGTATQGGAEKNTQDQNTWPSVLVVFNASEEPARVDLTKAEEETGMQFEREPAGLVTNIAEQVAIEEDTLTLPAYGITILPVSSQ